MQKTALIALTLLLAGCSATPWHEGLCPETDKKLIKKAYSACVTNWLNKDFDAIGSAELSTDHMELIMWSCEAKSHYKQCT